MIEFIAGILIGYLLNKSKTKINNRNNIQTGGDINLQLLSIYKLHYKEALEYIEKNKDQMIPSIISKKYKEQYDDLIHDIKYVYKYSLAVIEEYKPILLKNAIMETALEKGDRLTILHILNDYLTDFTMEWYQNEDPDPETYSYSLDHFLDVDLTPENTEALKIIVEKFGDRSHKEYFEERMKEEE